MAAHTCCHSAASVAVVYRSELCTLERAAWWAVQQGARAVAAARLRTPLGNPTQTFAALEAALLRALPTLEQGPQQGESHATRATGCPSLLSQAHTEGVAWHQP